jgi:hypothetical protein
MQLLSSVASVSSDCPVRSYDTSPGIFGDRLEMRFIVIRDNKDVITLVGIANWLILSFCTARGICWNEHCHVAARKNLYCKDSIRYVKLGWVVTLVWRWLISSFVCIHSSNAIKIITWRNAKGQTCRDCLEETQSLAGHPDSNALPVLMETLYSVLSQRQQVTNFEIGFWLAQRCL